MHMRQKTALFIAVLVLIQLAAFFAIDPRGNVSLNDDWFYARMVRDYTITDYEPDELITPVLLGQFWYAEVVTRIFGFRLEILRFSTMALALAATVTFFYLLHEFGVRRPYAFFVSLILFFNPLFFYLSATFMTDVPALAFVVFGIAALARFCNTRLTRYFVLGIAFLFYASIIRQSYAPLIVLTIIFIMPPDVRTKKNVAAYFVGVATSLALYALFYHNNWWPKNDIALHAFKDARTHLEHIKNQVYYIWHYTALFVAPLTLGVIPFALRSGSRTIQAVKYALLFGGGAYGLYKLFFGYWRFPYFGNIISLHGLGPRDTDAVLTGTPHQLLTLTQVIGLSVVVSLAAAILLVVIADVVATYRYKYVRDKQVILFSVLALASQVAVIFAFLSFDRYYLPITLFLLIIVAVHMRARTHRRTPLLVAVGWTAFGMLVVTALTVVVLTKMSLTEQRLKWKLADSLRSDGVPVANIDGGYEWLGWHWYGKTPASVPRYWAAHVPWYVSRLFPDNQRTYVITYEPKLAGYTLLSAHHYGTILQQQLYLYVHKKNED